MNRQMKTGKTKHEVFKNRFKQMSEKKVKNVGNIKVNIFLLSFQCFAFIHVVLTVGDHKRTNSEESKQKKKKIGTGEEEKKKRGEQQNRKTEEPDRRRTRTQRTIEHENSRTREEKNKKTGEQQNRMLEKLEGCITEEQENHEYL